MQLLGIANNVSNVLSDNIKTTFRGSHSLRSHRDRERPGVRYGGNLAIRSYL